MTAPNADTVTMADGTQVPRSEITTWTPELRADLQAHVQSWYDRHPGLREGLSEGVRGFWASAEGEALRAGLSAAAAGGQQAAAAPPAPRTEAEPEQPAAAPRGRAR